MKNNDKTTLETPSRLLEDLRSLVKEAEKLMRNDTDDPSKKVKSEALQSQLARTQTRLGDLYEDTKKRVAAGAKSADASLRANPYQSLAIAAGIGLLVGLLSRHSAK